jgi:hypothetical protein
LTSALGGGEWSASRPGIENKKRAKSEKGEKKNKRWRTSRRKIRSRRIVLRVRRRGRRRMKIIGKGESEVDGKVGE